MPNDVVYQDILMDYIKEFRKILSGLLHYLNEAENNECRSIRDDFNTLLFEEYPYAYSGLDNIQSDFDTHKNEITRIMTELNKLDDEESKKIYDECYSSYIYQYYYLENINHNDNG